MNDSPGSISESARFSFFFSFFLIIIINRLVTVSKSAVPKVKLLQRDCNVTKAATSCREKQTNILQSRIRAVAKGPW